MFVLQPLFGELLLPLLGGTPAVWNSCMVFYQSLLFMGYLYAHVVGTRLTVRYQVIVHFIVIALSFFTLPVGLPENLMPPLDSHPTFWLFSTLASAIGLPFFILSTTALMQKWFAHMEHSDSNDPHFLYAASNSGSLISLLSYPFLIEPTIGLHTQQLDWSIGYLILCTLDYSAELFYGKASINPCWTLLYCATARRNAKRASLCYQNNPPLLSFQMSNCCPH
jgi:hypothetical protein